MLQASNKWLLIMFITPSRYVKTVNNRSTKVDPEGLTLQIRMSEVIAKIFSTRRVNFPAIF